MKKVIQLYNQIEEKFLVYTFLFMIIIVFTQVVLRLVGHANSWSEELARYIYIWECWAGVSFCQRHHEHIRITLVLDRLPGALKKINEIIVILLCIAVAAIMAYLGFEMVHYLIRIGTGSPYMGIPNWIIYAAMPVGCIAYILRLLIDGCYLITGKEEAI